MALPVETSRARASSAPNATSRTPSAASKTSLKIGGSQARPPRGVNQGIAGAASACGTANVWFSWLIRLTSLPSMG
jgi:hypothetical protein